MQQLGEDRLGEVVGMAEKVLAMVPVFWEGRRGQEKSRIQKGRHSIGVLSKHEQVFTDIEEKKR